MKIAVCAKENNSDTTIDSRFGRAAFFAVYDSNTKEINFIPNTQNMQAAQGAGIQAAQTVVDSDATVLLANNIGPKAMKVFKLESVQVYKVSSDTKLMDAITQYTEGKAELLEDANAESHSI